MRPRRKGRDISTKFSRIRAQETIGSDADDGTASGSDGDGEPGAVGAYERVDIDRYAVVLGSTVGYVDVVPPLFICYAGHPYSRAMEIAQVHDFDAAVRLVQDHAPQAPSLRAAG